MRQNILTGTINRVIGTSQIRVVVLGTNDRHAPAAQHLLRHASKAGRALDALKRLARAAFTGAVSQAEYWRSVMSGPQLCRQPAPVRRSER